MRKKTEMEKEERELREEKEEGENIEGDWK